MSPEAGCRAGDEEEGQPCPVVSLCIPAYEPDAGFLDDLFASIEAQKYASLEVVIVDDASSTPVDDMLRPWKDRLPLTVYRNPKNLGMVPNWNEAVRRSGGELAMVVCQDDVLADGMIHRYVDEFDAGADTVLCSSGEMFIDADGQLIGRPLPFNHRGRIFVHHDRYLLDQTELIRLCLRNGQVYGEPSAVMFRRKAFDRVGGYREEFVHAPDLDFNLRAAAEGKAVYLSDPYLHRRLHKGNLTRQHVASGAATRDRVRLYEEYSPRLALDNGSRDRLRAAMMSSAVYDGVEALRGRRWGVVRQNVADIWRYRARPARPYLERIQEVLSRENLDER